MLLPLVVWLAAAPAAEVPPRPLELTVVVPLCDGAHLACGAQAAGDPRSLDANLYWGAMFGAERFLSKARGFRVASRTDAPDPERPGLLRVVVIERASVGRERAVRLTLEAWDGARIDDALASFLSLARAGSAGDLLVWAGHDRLMDVAAPAASGPSSSTSARVAVLACESERYFGPALAAAGATPVALTRTFMAPEAYLLEALAVSVARDGVDDRRRLREALVAAYAKYQRISNRAAASVFSNLE